MITLISDWNTVFYRKALIYKKRAEKELNDRRRGGAKPSLETATLTDSVASSSFYGEAAHATAKLGELSEDGSPFRHSKHSGMDIGAIDTQ